MTMTSTPWRRIFAKVWLPKFPRRRWKARSRPMLEGTVEAYVVAGHKGNPVQKKVGPGGAGGLEELWHAGKGKAADPGFDPA